MPYSNLELPEHQITSHHNQERNLWSVGMMLLEFFVGKDLVRSFRTNDDVLEAVTCVSNQFGA